MFPWHNFETCLGEMDPIHTNIVDNLMQHQLKRKAACVPEV